jgi:hypothetical protein
MIVEYVLQTPIGRLINHICLPKDSYRELLQDCGHHDLLLASHAQNLFFLKSPTLRLDLLNNVPIGAHRLTMDVPDSVCTVTRNSHFSKEKVTSERQSFPTRHS